MNADKLIDFMRRLVHDSKKKVFLFLDHLSVHRAKKVTAWVEKHKDKTDMLNLPPYDPEYNPNESNPLAIYKTGTVYNYPIRSRKHRATAC